MSKEYLADEMRKMEEKLLRQEDQLRDRYSTQEEPLDVHDFKKIVSAKIKLAPETGEKLIHYIERVQIYQEISHTKNWDTHVDNPYKVWHTHKHPLGCFMCEDQQFIRVLVQVLQVISSGNHKFKF